MTYHYPPVVYIQFEIFIEFHKYSFSSSFGLFVWFTIVILLMTSNGLPDVEIYFGRSRSRGTVISATPFHDSIKV